VHFDADGASLMVVDAHNRVHLTPIETGQHSQGYVELLKGPPAGSLVALGGSAFVLDGDKVRPVLANPAPARVAEASP
jgi:HlyD family secretion protein